MKRPAFTLIELLVVIAIIGLLATLAVVSFSGAIAKGRDTKRKNDLVQIQKALNMYFDDHEAYPSTGGAWWGGGSTCTGYGAHATTGTNGYIPDLAPQYMGVLPLEPRPGTRPYWALCVESESCYLYRSNGTSYKLLSVCGIEGTYPTVSDQFYDSVRPAYAITVCSDSTSCAW